MAQGATFFITALVALHVQVLVTTAAPLSPQSPAGNIVWVTSTTVTSVEATVTDIITAFNPHEGSASTPTSAPADTTTVDAHATQTMGAGSSNATPASWALPEFFEDLSPLGINKLASGSHNIEIVTGVPATASAASTPSSAASADSPESPTVTPLPRPWTNTSSVYRIFYPSGSINPRNTPQGGSEFYATPGNLPLKTASNVTLEYSIFFPADFEWVRGGKLPGLYGGHKGCSGGNSAESCFSTRLMWRKGGAGELYLYAPKDKQTADLCNAPPQSECNAAYGLSVGRGSFYFAAGRWTHVSQTVRLNTPGKQDGGFDLLVNGRRIMRREDVFYRDVPQSDSDNEGQDNGRDRGLWRRMVQAIGYDVLQPILPFILGPEAISGSEMPGLEDGPFFHPAATPSGASTVQNPGGGTLKPEKGIKIATSTSVIPPTAAAASPALARVASQSDSGGPVGFSGLFFSTFFGGHEQSWASPKDQYTWFKDFGMSINT